MIAMKPKKKIPPSPDIVEVIGLGQASVDYLGQLPRYPHEDEKIELECLEIQCGGPASTAMVTLSRLGIAAAFMGSFSDDSFGKKIQQGLEDEGIDATFSKVTTGYRSQFAFIGVSPGHGMRTIFWHPSTTPPLAKEDVDLSKFPRAKILHLDDLMVAAAHEAALQAKDRGLLIVLDAGTMREGILEVIPLVDVLIASEHFHVPFLGAEKDIEEVLHTLFEYGPGEVIVTRGDRGSIGWDGYRIIIQEAFPVNARDTTGAGDVYHGAYIYGVLQGWDIEENMRFAAAVSAMKCRFLGARKGIPSLTEVTEFLNK
jgi:ribokinase